MGNCRVGTHRCSRTSRRLHDGSTRDRVPDPIIGVWPQGTPAKPPCNWEVPRSVPRGVGDEKSNQPVAAEGDRTGSGFWYLDRASVKRWGPGVPTDAPARCCGVAHPVSCGEEPRLKSLKPEPFCPLLDGLFGKPSTSYASYKPHTCPTTSRNLELNSEECESRGRRVSSATAEGRHATLRGRGGNRSLAGRTRMD